VVCDNPTDLREMSNWDGKGPESRGKLVHQLQGYTFAHCWMTHILADCLSVCLSVSVSVYLSACCMYLAVLLTAVQVGGGYVFISSLSKNCRQILKNFCGRVKCLTGTS